MTEEQAQAQPQEAASSDAPEIARPFLLGRKVGMLQHFRPDGTVVGATIISAEPNTVTFVRTRERDGYAAVQIGYGALDEKRMPKPALGHLKGLSALRELREIRLDDVSGFERGQRIGVGRFTVGDKVDISGVSKGKGFQGPVHLHHFRTGPKTHGSDHWRRQGSVGAGTTPGRVLKGMRMARKMGVDRVTVKNLEVLRADAERGVLIIKGAIPGARNGVVLVRKA